MVEDLKELRELWDPASPWVIAESVLVRPRVTLRFSPKLTPAQYDLFVRRGQQWADFEVATSDVESVSDRGEIQLWLHSSGATAVPSLERFVAVESGNPSASASDV